MSVVATGLTVLASSTVDGEPPALAGFVVSSFSPLVAEAAERCLRAYHGEPPVEPARGARTALVIASPTGDVTSAVHVARCVDSGSRVGPLLFFQSVPNAVAGHVAARWGLAGPVVCVSPAGDPMDEGLDVAALLMDDGDAGEALVVAVEQGGAGTGDRASAVLVRTEGETR
jgi:3-oxoacyl-(acyl-carrier-protein) synthase